VAVGGVLAEALGGEAGVDGLVRSAPAVAVAIGVPRGSGGGVEAVVGVVGEGVAVVVAAVARFAGRRADEGVVVVAVVAGVDHALGRQAGEHAEQGAAMAVAVAVGVPAGGGAAVERGVVVVGAVVAVVVVAVARLDGAGAHRFNGVVAVVGG